jgi:hypothetical protein
MEWFVVNGTTYVGISIWWFVILLALIVFGFVLAVGIGFYFKKYAPEAYVYAAARKKGLPILRITDSTDAEELYLGVKERHDDPIFKTKAYGVQLSPSMQSIALTNRTRDGVPIHNFSVHFPFSIAARNARAIQTILEYVRTNPKYAMLNFLPDMELISLVGTPRDHLEHDTQNYLDEHQPEIEKDTFIQLIMDIQDETRAIPVKQGFFSYSLAFENIASAFSGQDLHQVKLLIERIVRDNVMKEEKMLKLLLYGGLGFAGIIIAGAIAFTIIKSF